MRIHTNVFATADEASEARKELPYCGSCGANLKAQRNWRGDSWALTCTRRPDHTVSISDRGQA